MSNFLRARCPRCQSLDVYRSTKRGRWERFGMLIFMLRPLRCRYCMHRFARPIFRSALPHPGHQGSDTTLTAAKKSSDPLPEAGISSPGTLAS